MLEDIYDVVALLLGHAARTGLGEALVSDATRIIEAVDPKIAVKRAAAEAEQARVDAEMEQFRQWQAYQARAAAGAAPAADGSTPEAPAGFPPPAAPPVVTS